MKAASVELQSFMLKQIKDAVEKHKEETKSNNPLYLIMNSRDFKRMRSVRAMKARVHYYSFVPEGTFYLSETKPNPKDYGTPKIDINL
jgi:hypothetical protein